LNFKSLLLQDVKLLRHDLFTNDVLYLELALDLRPLPSHLLPLLPLFCRWARHCSTQHHPVVQYYDASAAASVQLCCEVA